MMVDPLANLQIAAESYDIERDAYVYFNNAGTKCWTKAWFNKKEEGEKAIEITRQLAIQAINHEISKDEWLARFYPKQMSACSKALEEARKMMLGI